MAANYGQWQVAITNTASSYCVDKVTVVLADGSKLQPWSTTNGTSLLVGSPGNQETVTPTAFNYISTPGQVCISGTFTKAHFAGEPVSSGTFGLQEALNAAGVKLGGAVTIDQNWTALGGTTAIKNAATLPTNVTIEDARAGISGGGGSGTVSAGTAGQMAIYASTGTTVQGDANVTDASNLFSYLGTSGMVATAGPVASGANGGAAGVAKLFGSTSGAATLIAPAVAGTATNPVVASNFLSLPNGGTTCVPSYTFAGQLASGLANYNGSFIVALCTSPTNWLTLGSNGAAETTSNGSFQWSDSTTFGSGPGTQISRPSSGNLSVDTATQGNGQGKLQSAGFISSGTKFTQDTGCGTIATSSGGATVGQFTTVGSTSCTTVVTFGNTATSAHNWACFAHDLTTSADYNNPHVSSNTTTATIVTGTIVSGDVIEFACVGY